MDIKSTSRTIVETTHVVTMDKADQAALFAVAARNKLGAASDAPATIARTDEGSITVTIVMSSSAPVDDAPATAPSMAAPQAVVPPIV